MELSGVSATKIMDLLTRWQAFSVIQQRAFAFLAAEALAAGQQFEDSTGGASDVLQEISTAAQNGEKGFQDKIFQVVYSLQATDQSRQGLEQVASVLDNLRTQHEKLVDFSRDYASLPTPDTENMVDAWVDALTKGVTLADWRQRLKHTLHGWEVTQVAGEVAPDDDELF